MPRAAEITKTSKANAPWAGNLDPGKAVSRALPLEGILGPVLKKPVQLVLCFFFLNKKKTDG